MKLSQLSTDKALDVLCEITPGIAAIVEDPEVSRVIESMLPEKGKEGEENSSTYAVAFGMIGGIGKLAPLLFRTHREDVYGILAAVNERPEEEIAAQGIMLTISQFKEVFEDQEFLDFFKSFLRRGKTA